MRHAKLTAFWTALACAKEEVVDGVTYMVLKDGHFPQEGSFVVDKLLVRKCYVDLAGLAKDYLEKKRPTGEQLPGCIFILRGNAGESIAQLDCQSL